MLHRTEAIVLKTTPFSEADLIVTFLTSDFGLLKTFAKSPRKTKSRFGSSLEPLTYSRISFWGREDTNLPRLTQSDIIKSFQSIRDRLKCFLGVAEMIELTLSLLPEREANRGIFNLLIYILNRIEKECSGIETTKKSQDPHGHYVILYKIRFLDMAGYGPRLDGCARCRRSGYNFYISHGSIICEACARDLDAPMKLSPGVIKLYGILRGWDISKIDRIKPSRTLLSELSSILDNHIRYTTAKPLRTTAFRS
ncbi:MAG: DNA repair protein RecO [Thermodesulfovibrionales bacterium]